MRLLSLRVGGFGGLAPGEYRFADRALIVADNAAGKSTLAAAIRAALYGLEADRRRQRGLTDHEAHRPWRGDAYAVALTLETREGLFVVERDFAHAGGGGQLAVRDGAGADVTARFLAGKGRDRVGEQLAGVSEAAFQRAVFAADRAWSRPWTDDDAGELTDLLGRAVASDEGGGPASSALAACEEALARYEGVTVKGPARVETEIQRLEQRLREIRDDRDGTQRRHEQALAALADLEARRAELQRLDASLAANRARRLRAQAGQLRRALAARRAAEDELAHAREASAALAHLAGFAPGREAEMAAWAERCAAHGREAAARRRHADEVLRPELAAVEAGLAATGEPGAGVTTELATGVAALLEREARLAELRTERERLRARIAQEGEDLALQERLHAGLARLGETERRFLREQERLGFARDEQVARLEREERTAFAAMAEWNAAIARLGRARTGAGVAAGAALLGGAAALLLAPADASGQAARLGGVAGLLIALAAGVAWAWLHRRRATLARRRELQGSQRLAALAAEREELAGREVARRERLAEIAPALLGPQDAAALAPDPDGLDVLCRRHESFRIRHDGWFRLGERLGEEETEIARLRARLAPFAPAAADDAPPPATAALQAELARRQRAAELDERARRGREALATALREADEHDAQADEAARRAAALLAVLPPGCRWETEAAGDVPAPATEGVSAAIAPLAAAFRRDPAAAADWYAARAAEAARARRLADETIPALERRAADLPPVEETARKLANVEGELSLEAAAAAAGGADATPPPAPETLSVEELLAQGEALQSRREKLAAAIAEGAREVALVERERRAHLPELARRERELRGALDRARDFRDAVTLARDTIARLAGDVHARWAQRLDEDAGRLAKRLCPEIAAIAFTPELDYAVTLAGGQRLDSARADRQLSTGVRDQLALAVRLALARFLARPGEPLPLVLDDPFARYDDARYHRGMGVLLEETTGHQVILLTCHDERLRWLEQLDPVVARAWTRVRVG